MPNTQNNQCRAQWQLESVCPASSFVTVDSEVARNPQLVILQTVSSMPNRLCDTEEKLEKDNLNRQNEYYECEQ